MNIQELAALAGVSVSTVSRVFSHRPGIREELRLKVLALAREHGYHPRFTAREKNVVVITPYDSVFPVQSCVDMILMSLAQELPRCDFRMEILPVNNLERLENIQFCGAAAIGCEAEDFPGWAERFAVPLVIMDRAPRLTVPEQFCFIHSDEAQGMKIAIDHLYARQCRRIGCIIHGTPERGNALLRRQAIVETLRRYGQDDENMIHYSGDGEEKYVELIGRLLKKGVDALFCPGGNAGILALYAFSLFGRSVPGDVSLISSEQTAFSMYTVPPLTTISPDYSGLARELCAVLTAWMDNEPLKREVSLPYRLIARDSCR